ncbi:MAG TPA: hypothetical protein PKK00_10655 [Bacteroidales bacterium]|mgnify:CR=1 FL=1|nr:hypothetical protein [Bacteroidales bacterium]HPS17784.1 hypothetical protein [Bacteroidales bacterium]
MKNKSYKNIISIFLLGIFLLPTIIKLEHHHEHYIYKSDNKKHIHEFHHKCEICKFEFSTYTPSPVKTANSKNVINYFYNNIYTSAVFIEQNILSFSLRAPPLV